MKGTQYRKKDPAEQLRTFVFWLLLGELVLVPLCFWHGFLFPYTFPKTIIFRILIEAALVPWVLLLWMRPALRANFFTPLGAAVTAYGGALLLSAYTGVNGQYSFWSGYERMFGVFTQLHIIFFFFMLTTVVREKREWNILFQIVAGVVAIVSLGGVLQGFTSTDLSISTIGNAAFLSSFLVLGFFYVAVLLMKEERISWKSAYYASILCFSVMSIFFTQARAGVLGLGAGILLLIVLFLVGGTQEGTTLSISHRILKRMGIAALVAIAVVVIGVLVFQEEMRVLVPRQYHQFLEFNLTQRTASGRLLTWGVAWEGWKDRFLFGWGPENFQILFNTHYNPQLYMQEPWFDRAHNIIFDIGTTSGAVGLVTYAGMFILAGVSAVRLWRQNRSSFWEMGVVISLLLAHLCQNLFTFDSITSLPFVFLAFAFMGARQEAYHTSLETVHGIEKNKRGPLSVIVISVLVVGFLIFYTNIRPLLANRNAHNGWESLRTLASDDIAIAYFNSALAYEDFGSLDIRRFTAEYIFEFLKQGGKRPDDSLRNLIDYAVRRMGENISADPRNVKWYMYRGELYSILAQKFDPVFAKNAEVDFLKARELSPGRPQIYLELAQARKVAGDVDGAWKYLEHILRIIPDFSFSHLNAAVLAIETGNREREEIEIAWLTAHDNLGVESLRDAYFLKKRYKEAVHIQELIVDATERSSKNYTPAYRIQVHQQLAALYVFAGEIEKARNMALMVLALDPTKKSEVEAFLRTLPPE